MIEFYDPAEYEPDEPELLRFTHAVAQVQRMMARGELFMTGSIIRYMQQLGRSLPEDQHALYQQYLSDVLAPWAQEEVDAFTRTVSAFQHTCEAISEPPPPNTGPVRNQFARRGRGVKRR